MKSTIYDLNTLTRTLPYFTKHNLSIVLNQKGSGLNYWIKKLITQKLLIPLKSGFYISPEYETTQLINLEKRELYWVYIANTLYAPSYVSLEYVLSRNGIIPESVFAVTSITLKRTRTFSSSPTTFIYRNLQQSYYYGYKLGVFTNGLTIRIADSPKALFDFLYFKPFVSKEYFEEYLFSESRINWDALSNVEKNQFITYCKKSGSEKMNQISKIVQNHITL